MTRKEKAVKGPAKDAAASRRPPERRRVVFHTSLLRGTNTSVGGITTWTVRLANGLADAGFEVHIAVRADEESMQDPERAKVRAMLGGKVKVTFLGESRRIATFKLGLLIRRVRARTLVTAGHTFTERGVRLRRLFGPALHLVATVRANCTVEMKTLPEGKWDRYRAMIAKYGRADAVISVSDGVREDLVHNFGLEPALVRTIYNPIISDEWLEAAKGPPPIELPPRYVLGVGRLVYQKDFETLLRAFAIAAPQAPDVDLLILGEGADRPALTRLAGDLGIAGRVTMPGHIGNPAPVMARAALLASSSRWEGIANAIVEATGLGVPVVATDCPSGPAEVLENGRLGRLVPVGDFQALAQGMLATLSETPDRDALRARGAHFSDTRSIAEYAKLFEGGGEPDARTRELGA